MRARASIIVLMKKYLTAVLLAGIFLVGLSGCLRSKEDTSPVDLIFYGLDESGVFESLIAQYRERNPRVRVKYKKFSDPETFESLLVNEIAEGEGPDVFYAHNTWLPRHSKKLSPLVSENFTVKQFQESFVQVASDDFIQPDPRDGNLKIYAMPLYVDTLAMYYNKTDFEKKVPERGKPAATWEAFQEDAPKFREQGLDGVLEKGLVFLSLDALYNFFLQAGITLYDGDFKRANFLDRADEMFHLYLTFSNAQHKNFSFSPNMLTPGSSLGEVETFLSGKVSSVLAYSDLYPRLETELRNISSRVGSSIGIKDVGVAPVPQLSTDESKFRTFANYYGLAVSRNSKNPQVAWDFVGFLASKAQAKTYHEKTKRPAARRDLIAEQKKEPITEVFAGQVGFAGSYRIFDDSRFAQILKDAVNGAAGGQSERSALTQAQEKMNKILEAEAPEGLYPKPKKKK